MIMMTMVVVVMVGRERGKTIHTLVVVVVVVVQ